MWFFFRRNRKKCSLFDKLIAGIIIGGAIGSIIGKKLLEKREGEGGEHEQNGEAAGEESPSGN